MSKRWNGTKDQANEMRIHDRQQKKREFRLKLEYIRNCKAARKRGVSIVEYVLDKGRKESEVVVKKRKSREYSLKKPTQSQIKKRCMEIRKTWTRKERMKRLDGLIHEKFNVPFVLTEHERREQEKDERAKSEGRYSRHGYVYFNTEPEKHEAVYRGNRDNLICDCPVWWDGI